MTVLVYHPDNDLTVELEQVITLIDLAFEELDAMDQKLAEADAKLHAIDDLIKTDSLTADRIRIILHG